MLHVVIMAGGSGTRFWPASRTLRPKQFLALASARTLLRETFDRIAPLAPPERIWVVTNASTVAQTRRELPELPAANVLGEPAGRDTAACVGYAAVMVQSIDDDAVCLVLPADHVIGDEERFRDAMLAGAAHVEAEGGLLSFGIQPTMPETGYGYLKVGAPHRDGEGHRVHRLERFVEKPDLATAERYMASGEYLWNAGIFAWRAEDLRREIARQLPRLAAGLDEIAAAIGGPDEAANTARIYPDLQRISIDFGVMEGAERCWVLPVSFPWSDVGSWSALPAVLAADDDGNTVRGRVLALDSAGNIAVSDGPAIALVDVSELIVVATADGVLVAPRSKAQRVKEVVAALEERGWTELL